MHAAIVLLPIVHCSLRNAVIDIKQNTRCAVDQHAVVMKDILHNSWLREMGMPESAMTQRRPEAKEINLPTCER